jgi:hypothetical protein
MAGLVAPTLNWEFFEANWKAALNRFDLPYFHMQDFAQFKGAFRGWTEDGRRELFDALLRIIIESGAMPFGSIVPLAEYKKVTGDRQAHWVEPYYVCMVSCIGLVAAFHSHTSFERVALVFSEQAKFKHQALGLFEDIRQHYTFAQKALPPSFHNMRELVPLQAADLIAYEMKKEYERRAFKPETNPRYGYRKVESWLLERNFDGIPFVFFDAESISKWYPPHARDDLGNI